MPGASSKAQSSHSQLMPATAARTGWGWWLWICTGPCPVVLGASGLQWGQGDRSCPIRSQCQGHSGVFWLLVLPGPPFTRWELGTSPTPSASHPTQESSGVPSEPGWGAGCWNRVQ